MLRKIVRPVHTIEGTRGVLGLPRPEGLAYAAETLMGRFRDGLPAPSNSVTPVLATLDSLGEILAGDGVDLGSRRRQIASLAGSILRALESLQVSSGLVAAGLPEDDPPLHRLQEAAANMTPLAWSRG